MNNNNKLLIIGAGDSAKSIMHHALAMKPGDVLIVTTCDLPGSIEKLLLDKADEMAKDLVELRNEMVQQAAFMIKDFDRPEFIKRPIIRDEVKPINAILPKGNKRRYR